MISPNSDLMQNHPDWVMRTAEYEPLLGRSQYILDLNQRRSPDIHYRPPDAKHQRFRCQLYQMGHEPPYNGTGFELIESSSRDRVLASLHDGALPHTQYDNDTFP